MILPPTIIEWMDSPQVSHIMSVNHWFNVRIHLHPEDVAILTHLTPEEECNYWLLMCCERGWLNERYEN